MDKFDLKKFLTENKLTRTSVLREGVEDDIEKAIKDKTLIAVTDGLYMNKMYPSMNSCAFIL